MVEKFLDLDRDGQFAFSNDGKKVWATVLPLSTIMHREDCIYVFFMPYLQDLGLLRSGHFATMAT